MVVPAAAAAARGRRWAPPSWRKLFSSSWMLYGLIFLAVSQVVTVYLLVDLAGRQQSSTIYEPIRMPLPPNNQNPLRRRKLFVGSTDPASCVKQVLSPGQCSDETKAVRRSQQSERATCTFDLEETDVVFGVWHSLATEGRLQPLLDTWGRRAQIVLLASSIGVRESKLFKEGVPGSRPHLLDTGIEQDDYFSTLGKAFVGLRLMLEAYPKKKWFVILGDDNYVHLDNYVNALSAFDPDQPWAISRMVYRQKFGCKVAGGASIITSRAMTQELAPHLEPWYNGIVERSGGNVNKAREEDKFHDIAFQKLVEHIDHSWVHLDELPHEPPGFYFDARLGVAKADVLPERSALFHYVPGQYMYYLHFVSSHACTCAVTDTEVSSALADVAVGVYSPFRRLSKLDEKRVSATWGKRIPQRRMLAASGKEYVGVRGDLARLRELAGAFPDAKWYLLLPVEHYLVAANLAVRIRKLEAEPAPGRRGVIVYGSSATRRRGEIERNGENSPSDGALLVGTDLTDTIFHFGEGLSGGVFPMGWRPGDRGIVEWARTLNSMTVVQDEGFVRRLPGPEWKEDVGCPATFPMDPDLADLKPEFIISEGDAVMPVTGYLLRTSAEKKCVARLKDP